MKTIIIRLSDDLRELAGYAARLRNCSLNAWVVSSIREAITRQAQEGPPVPLSEQVERLEQKRISHASRRPEIM